MPIRVVRRKSYFINVLNLSQLTKPKIGTKINPEKAREVLDTTIFELLPYQRTRQDDVDKFFQDFNNLIGAAPLFDDIDDDGAGEFIPDGGAADSGSRISEGDTPSAFITRLDDQANNLNQGKTLESMRNRLNTYLGDVDNVVQEIPDQRPEYENKSSGFLKIRKPNQAIILRNPNDELEFQKEVTVNNNVGPSFLMEGFTITMWVRFVGKTGGGTLFNFGNPTSVESPYGFRLDTFTHQDAGNYERFLRLVVYDSFTPITHDSHFGTSDNPKIDTVPTDIELNAGYRYNYVQIPTDDLNEWFFICATYNPVVPTVAAIYAEFVHDKQFWLNHKDSDGALVANSELGNRCKVEVISRSDLLLARGYKPG